MFGKHFRILNARMVQSVESIWAVLFIHVHRKKQVTKRKLQKKQTIIVVWLICIMHIVKLYFEWLKKNLHPGKKKEKISNDQSYSKFNFFKIKYMLNIDFL